MRRTLNITAISLLVSAAACGDLGTGPTLSDQGSSAAPPSMELPRAAGTVIINPPPPDECDPWQELDWCCDQQQTLVFGGATTLSSCPGNGDGGGSGGGGGGSGINFEVEGTIAADCPNCVALSPGQLAFMQAEATVNLICGEVRSQVIQSLQSGEWAARSTNFSIRGNHWTGFHNGGSAVHFSIDSQHPGFVSTTLSELQRRTEVAGLMAHEMYHHMFPGQQETQVDSMTGACVPGYHNY